MRCPSYEAFCASFDCLRNNEELAHSAAHNGVRDWIWTYFSYDLLNARLQATADVTFDLTGQWAGQQLYSTLGMVIFAIASKLAYKGVGKEFPTADVVASITAASAAIYTWDRGQAIGIHLGAKLGLSSATSGYFAGIFTGVEGPTQFLVLTLSKLLTKDEEWSQFKQNPKDYLLSKVKELGLSATLGLVPGAVWQIVFNAGLLANLGPVATCFLVAAAVGVCNVIYAKTSKAILESDCCISLCGQSREKEPLETVQASPFSSLLSCLGMFKLPCCGREEVTGAEQQPLNATAQSML